ncbi:MAG: protein kinase [Oscillospiraceae bacterium]|nr:protein kinase [Oscillospiraceae bacterium]
MSDLKLCYGCMEPLDGERVCPHCGYEQDATSLANYLKPGTMLHDRFLIGKTLEFNGEGVTYLGYDTAVGCKILIREYLPEQLCSRVPNSTEVNVSYAHLAQYKALMAEYTELNKALARLRNLSHLNPALDLFSENNTTYAVYEYLEGQSLLDYLKENAGELSWSTVRRIFPPLFTTLSLLHNAGVLHRGLSPETIFVTDKGELKLRGFCISAVRTNDTELDAELFDGYAAPEQYFADRQQGTWTDVYGICAVLYRILTGCRATDAISREDYDNLVPPIDLNPHMPENVSKGIMQGLALDGNERVRTVTDLVTLLFEEPAAEDANEPKTGTTAVFSVQSDMKRVAPAQQAPVPDPFRQQQPAAPQRPAQQRPMQQRSGQRPVQQRPNPQRVSQQRPGQQRPAQRQNPQRQPVRQGSAGAVRSAAGRPAQGIRQAGGSMNRQAAPASRGMQRTAAGQPAAGRQRPASGAMTRSSAGMRTVASRTPAGTPARRRPVPATERGRKVQEASVFEKLRAPLLIAILFIAIITVVIMAFAKLLENTQNKNQSIYNRESSVEQDNIISADSGESSEVVHPDAYVPKVVGMSFTAKRDENAGWLNLEPEYVFDERYAKDTIIAQEFEPGTEFVSGSSMKVTVSLGSSLITIPSYKGLKLNAYLNQLKEMGLVEAVDGDNGNPGGTTTTEKNKRNKTTTTTVTDAQVTPNADGKRQIVMYKAKVDWNYANGYVCGVEPAAGKIIDALDDYQIIVYYAYNPVYTTIVNGTTNSDSSSTKKTKTTKTTATTVDTETNPPVSQTQPPASDTQPPPASSAEPAQSQAPAEGNGDT